MASKAFWKGQRVLLTGHTGFKGAWLSLWLDKLGASVTGVALAPDTVPSLFRAIDPVASLTSHFADIRDRDALAAIVREARPTLVIHMAAQALVRRGYRTPVETFAVNVMGTAHLMDALRDTEGLKAILVVTTDKVYRNLEDGRAFREDDALGAHDPYSASKAATEIAVSSWAQSYFRDRGVPVATARAGNVIGGGDWSEDRLIPDTWRAITSGQKLVLRNPDSTRPWQHVLEPLAGYMRHVEALTTDTAPEALNFGPYPSDVLKVADVAEALLAGMGHEAGWHRDSGANPPEMRTLSLDPGLAERAIGWRPRLTSRQAIAWTAEWYGRFDRGEAANDLCLEQISRYEDLP